MTKIEPRTLKGFPDYAPKEQLARQAMFSKIQSSFERFGFLPLSTPVLEYKEILMGKYGEDEKLVYSFQDNGDRDVAMRYDLTVPLARFVAQNQGQLTLPFKRYQIAPVWRAENTQRGRLREFYQCDIDVVGTENQLSDAEVAACLCKTLEELGVKKYELRINDRKLFNLFSNNFAGGMERIVEVLRAVDKFYKIGKQGVLNILKEKDFSETELMQVAAMLEWGLNAEAFANIRRDFPEAGAVITEMENLIGFMVVAGVPLENIVFDPLITRGLDYYTGVVFEISITDGKEFGSIVGGGRYDSLVDQFSNTPLPAVGGSIGIDRLFEYLESKKLLKAVQPVKVLVLNLDKSLQREYVALATQLRDSGMNAELYFEVAKLDKQFKYAESKGIPFAVLIGEDEKNRGVVKIKNLQTRAQEEIPRAELLRKLS